MDWQAAVERNREALKRILVTLVAMAGLVSDSAPGTLPRHLHRAVLRLLRPAEAATRRLVIAAARGLTVTLPAARPRKAKPGSIFVRNGIGTGIVLPAGVPASSLLCWSGRGAACRPGKDATEGKPARPVGFQLFDPLRRFRPRRPARTAIPRISVPGFTRPFAIAARPRPSPDDPVDAARLALRLAALGRVLDDLPRQAKRFARWRCRVVAQREESRLVPDRRSVSPSPAREARQLRAQRIWPLRPGPPPGRRQADEELRKVLENTHGFALWALHPPDSS